MSKHLAFRISAVILWIALLSYVIRRAGLGMLLESLHRMGWRLALIIALGGISHLVKTWAWRLTLVGNCGRALFARMFQLRLMSEAAGQIGPIGQLFGEGLRVSALSGDIPVDSRVSSVTLDRALFVITGAVVSVVGIAAASLLLPLSDALRFYAVLLTIIVVGLLCVAAMAAVRRWPFLSSSARALSRIRCIGSRINDMLPLIHSVENRLYEFHHTAPFAFWASVGLNLVCHGLAVLEVYLILLLLGVKAGLLGALTFEAVTKLVNIAGSLNPGNIGTYEGGNILIARMFTLSATTGLSVAIARRVRAIFWAAAGLICLLLMSRHRVPSGSGNTPLGDVAVSSPSEEAERSRSLSALIFASKTESSLLQVGTLPVLLRTILAVRKLGASRILVYADPAGRRKAECELLETGRLPCDVEWIEPRSGLSLPRLLQQVMYESRAHELLVVDGSTSYQPALLRKACEWIREEGALSLTTAGKPIGIEVFSAIFAREAAELCPSYIYTVDELQAWLMSTSGVQCDEVEAESWQQIVTSEDRVAAERKLDRWLVKPTDGIFARWNRRISVPISRQLIKLPITPNMVSLFTLGVGVLAGIFFGCGGYWSVLVGAVLSVFASILDGCDGEVARLKLMESDFGCWLETVCDWLYYLFIFAGMSIGLSKNMRPATFIVWGSLLVFGAVMSFLITGFGRHRFAKGRPEQYLKIWQSHAERRHSNPILYIGRNTEFIIRRCFLPYALLFFALVNIMEIAFFLTAIGANLVWLMSLYSYGAFDQTRAHRDKTSSVSPEPLACGAVETL